MSIKPKSVLLFKASEGGDNYESVLKANNFEVKTVKTLHFTYRNIDVLAELLKEPDQFSGLIFSSPRCVNATHQAANFGKIGDLWGHKANYTVGEATHKEVLEKLGLDCKGKETGNSYNLSQLIKEENRSFIKPLLFPHGNLKTDTLKLELSNAKIEIQGQLVYETNANPTIANELLSLTQNFTLLPEYVIYFSPSGFHSSIEHLRKVPLDLNLVKFIAIGPVTETAILEADLKVHAVAKSPTPEAILNAMIL